jgi:hypothetical protein
MEAMEATAALAATAATEATAATAATAAMEATDWGITAIRATMVAGMAAGECTAWASMEEVGAGADLLRHAAAPPV